MNRPGSDPFESQRLGGCHQGRRDELARMPGMELPDWLLRGGRYLLAALTLSLAMFASGHAVIRRRESRAAVLWLIIIQMMPLMGSLLYFLLGINRLKRRAILLRGNLAHYIVEPVAEICSDEELAARLPATGRHLSAVAHAISQGLWVSLVVCARLGAGMAGVTGAALAHVSCSGTEGSCIRRFTFRPAHIDKAQRALVTKKPVHVATA